MFVQSWNGDGLRMGQFQHRNKWSRKNLCDLRCWGLLGPQWRGPHDGHPPESQSFMEAWWPRWHQQMTHHITGHEVLSLPFPVILTSLLLCFMCSKVWWPPPLAALNETLGHDSPDEYTLLALLWGWGHPRKKMASGLLRVVQRGGGQPCPWAAAHWTMPPPGRPPLLPFRLHTCSWTQMHPALSPTTAAATDCQRLSVTHFLRPCDYLCSSSNYIDESRN